jgi:RNA polymerase sigma-70 factor (ECF subfamily)
MIRKLPHEYREALSLVALHGNTQQAAANQVGLSLSGMKSRVQRGRELLKTMLRKCCHIQLDSKGSIIDYETRSATCQTCAG